MPHLVVIYGPPLSGKSSVALAVAGALPERTSVVSVDALSTEAIVVPDRDVVSELVMVHTQVRLMAASYLKNGYNTIVEGAFNYERDGVMHRHEQEIDQLVSLMRNLARSPLVVRLSASEAVLRARADTAGRVADVEAAMRIEAAYRPRYGNRTLHLGTDDLSVAEVAEHIKERMEAEEFA